MTATAFRVPALPAPTTAANAAYRLLTVAGSQVGYHEGRSKSGEWNNDTAYGLWYGLNGNAWCAMFVSWCAAQAGEGFTMIIPKHAYTPDGFNWFASRGLADGRKPPNRKGVAATGKGKPRVGDVMYVYSSSNGRISHVGLVEKVLSGGRVQTLEGNTNLTGSASGDGCYRLVRQVSSRLYFCHPQYAAAVTAAKPPASKPDTVTPPKEEDPMAAITKQDIQAAMEAALESKLSRFVTGDNQHDSQADAWVVSAQAWAMIRLPQLIAEGKNPQQAMTTVKDEVWQFLAPLWKPAQAKA